MGVAGRVTKLMTDPAKHRTFMGQTGNPLDFPDQPASILLVDDRQDKLLALEAVLAPLGENLVLARSGTEALRILLNQDFALIVLDVNMPGMDGFETASLLRQRKSSETTPIIFVSAINHSESHLSRGYSLGAVDYILAPIVPEILRAKVSFFIDLHKKTKQLQRQAETEAQLIREQAARAQAEAANQAKDRFLAVLSHELRTPLTPILFSSSMLSSDPTLPEHVRHELKIIARNVELEARLIDDLLDVTRISQEKLKLVFEIIDAHDLLRSALKVCSHEISAKNLTVRLELEARETRLRADSARLQQVFWNIIKNAVKFTPRDGQVTVRSFNSQNGGIRIEVIDSGIGIAPEVLPRIFDAFEQGGRSDARGLGLGLTISRAIVEQHGGRISASSEGSGRGATFVIELSNLASSSIRSSLPSSGTVSGAAAMPALAALRQILLVDDHVDSIRPMQAFLQTIGYEVATADSVAAALRVAGQKTFDLLVCDIGLPDGSGEDLLRQLRIGGHDFPGIALSGYGMEQDIARSRAAGFQIHLIKPVSPQNLQAAIDRLSNPGPLKV
jgi:signal transduction histidine kinase